VLILQIFFKHPYSQDCIGKNWYTKIPWSNRFDHFENEVHWNWIVEKHSGTNGETFVWKVELAHKVASDRYGKNQNVWWALNDRYVNAYDVKTNT